MSGQSTAHPLAGRLAAPSFVLPGTVAENARFLSGRVDEMALCFFEAEACLKYDENDLPPGPAEPSASGALRCHVHLPVDLPWPPGHGTAAAADLALAVCAKAAHLHPGLAVLHPPEGSPAHKRRLLRAFAARWPGPPAAFPFAGECGFLRRAGIGKNLSGGPRAGLLSGRRASPGLCSRPSPEFRTAGNSGPDSLERARQEGSSTFR